MGRVLVGMVIAVSAVALVMPGGGSAASEPRLVRDIGPVSSSNPSWLVPFGDKVIFGASDGSGNELWVTDGSFDGTAPLKDVNPGPSSSWPSCRLVVGTTLYFAAIDGVHGGELWKTDGSEEGTELVRDIRPGPKGSRPCRFARLGSELVFTANDGVHGDEVWKTDGTFAGTKLVRDVRRGAASSAVYEIATVRDRVFFSAADGTHGRELWKTDGTRRGTMLARDIRPGPRGSWPEALTPVRRKLFFFADDGMHGAELWKATAGTRPRLVKDICTGRCGSASDAVYSALARSGLPSLQGALYFPALNRQHGVELWRSAGSSSSTRLVKDVDPSNPSRYNSGPQWLAAIGGELYFAEDDGAHGIEPWKSDGSRAGTQLLKDIVPGRDDSITDWECEAVCPPVPQFTGVGSMVFFAARDTLHGNELWVTDGTRDGTGLAADIRASGDSYPFELTAFGDTLLFSADDGTHGRELWAFDP